MKIVALKDVSDIKFSTVSASRSETQEPSITWLTTTNFCDDNKICTEPSESNFVLDENMILQNNDIVIKRINPLFINYIDNISSNIYAGNNLIIVTPLDGVYPKYLAYILNDGIVDLSKASSVGAVLKSISRNELENMRIPLPIYKKQILIGDLWYNSIELKKMKTRLAEIEDLKIKYNLKKLIITNIGGNYNG